MDSGGDSGVDSGVDSAGASGMNSKWALECTLARIASFPRVLLASVAAGMTSEWTLEWTLDGL